VFYKRVRQLFAIAVIGLFSLSSTCASAAWFLPLPQLPGASHAGDAFAVSADGTTIAGTSHDGRSNSGATNQAVRWTVDGVIAPLNAGDSSIAQGVSSDGSIIVGYQNVSADQIAFRWSAATGAVNIGDLLGGQTSGRANDVSADGSVAVGLSFSSEGAQAFRWTAPTGTVGLGDLPGGTFGSEAFGISADGSTIVGASVSSNGIEAFHWTNQTGMIALGDLPGGGFFSEAYDTSNDGSVIVGRSIANNTLFPYRAFRWSPEVGLSPLPDISGIGPPAIARAVSADGNVIVGGAYAGDSAIAFAWDPFHGSRSIAELLLAQGAQVDGFELGSAHGVSADGLTIAGVGLPRGGSIFQPWVARLDPGTFIPEPGSMALLISSALSLTLFVWYRHPGDMQ